MKISGAPANRGFFFSVPSLFMNTVFILEQSDMSAVTPTVATFGTDVHRSLFSDVTPLSARTDLRKAITAAWRCPETELVPSLVDASRLPPDMAERSHALALQITRG